jgi:hypothetical protein
MQTSKKKLHLMHETLNHLKGLDSSVLKRVVGGYTKPAGVNGVAGCPKF